MDGFPTCMSVHGWYLWRLEEGIRSLGIGVRGGCIPTTKCMLEDTRVASALTMSRLSSSKIYYYYFAI